MRYCITMAAFLHSAQAIALRAPSRLATAHNTCTKTTA